MDTAAKYSCYAVVRVHLFKSFCHLCKFCVLYVKICLHGQFAVLQLYQDAGWKAFCLVQSFTNPKSLNPSCLSRAHSSMMMMQQASMLSHGKDIRNFTRTGFGLGKAYDHDYFDLQRINWLLKVFWINILLILCDILKW